MLVLACDLPNVPAQLVNALLNALNSADCAYCRHEADEPLEFSMSESPLRWQLTREQLPIRSDGTVAVPDASGLGVTLDPATVAQFRVG